MNDSSRKCRYWRGHAPSGEPTPAKKPRVAAHARHVAPSKRKSAKRPPRRRRPTAAAKSAKSPKKALHLAAGQQDRQVP